MKTFLLIVTLLGVASPAIGRQDYKEWCPFFKERPMKQDIMMLYMEPLEFVLKQEPGTFCEKWLASLQAVYNKMLEFNEKTLNDPPIDPRLESDRLKQQAAEAILNTLEKLFIETNRMLNDEKTCNGKKIEKGSDLESVLVQLTRTFYSTHDAIRRSASLVHIVMKMPKDIAEAVKEFKKSWDAQMAFNEEKFKKWACIELEREFIRKACRPLPVDSVAAAGGAGGPEPVPGLSAEEMNNIQWVKTRSEKYLSDLKTVSQIMGEKKKGPLDHLMSKIPQKKPKKPKFNSLIEVEDAYYQQIVPLLKLCGLESSFSDVPPADPLFPVLSKIFPPGERAFPAACEQFFCPNNVGLLQDPRTVIATDDPAEKAAFEEKRKMGYCRYADNYDLIQARYLAGFTEYIAEYKKTGKIPKRGFCPSEAGPRREFVLPDQIHQIFPPPGIPRADERVESLPPFPQGQQSERPVRLPPPPP